MFIRALFAFLALPGIVAFAIPVAWLVATSRTALVQPLGLLSLLAGCVGLLWCVRGTRSAWASLALSAHDR